REAPRALAAPPAVRVEPAATCEAEPLRTGLEEPPERMSATATAAAATTATSPARARRESPPRQGAAAPCWVVSVTAARLAAARMARRRRPGACRERPRVASARRASVRHAR